MKSFTFWKFRITKKPQIEINNPNLFVFVVTIKKVEGWFKNYCYEKSHLYFSISANFIQIY